MRRADRLFQIVQKLRSGKLTRARDLALWLEVSERTIYRDIADLMKNGLPIDGEAGLGYMMRDGYDLPPLMFTNEEIVALTIGADMVRAWGGTAMSRAAHTALDKIATELPEALKARVSALSVHAIPRAEMTPQTRARIDQLEAAIVNTIRLELGYRDKDGAVTSRPVRPLALLYWGPVWTLVGWCELRDDFRMFRVDRIEDATADGQFAPEPGQGIEDFYALGEEDGYAPPDLMVK